MLDTVILSAQEAPILIRDYLEWVIMLLTVLGMWYSLNRTLSKPIKLLEEKVDKKADKTEVTKIISDVDCFKKELQDAIKTSEARTIHHIDTRVDDLKELIKATRS